jgi:hypothetical protein
VLELDFRLSAGMVLLLRSQAVRHPSVCDDKVKI